MTTIEDTNRLETLRAVAVLVAAALLAKVLIAILIEYRWYFPADFESSAFLSGRRHTFVGVYPTAFYAHIISGPLVFLLGALMMLSGGRPQYRRVHRASGRLLILLVLAVLVPSGLVMARSAYAGPIAAYGFGCLSVLTGLCAAAAMHAAITKNFRSHRRWATRCFILLASPLLLRLVSGAVIVTQLESEWTYRLNAWLSWLLPLVVYELYTRWPASGERRYKLQ